MTSWPCESFLPLWLTTSRFSTPEGGASAQRTRTLETAVHLRTPKAEAVGAGRERWRGRRQQGGGGREGGGRWRVKAVSGVLGTSRGAAGGTRRSLWGEKAVMGEGKQREADEEAKGGVSHCLPWDSDEGTTHDLWDTPTQGRPYEAMGTTEAPRAKYTPPPTLPPPAPPFFFSPSPTFFFFFLMPALPISVQTQLW